MVFDQNETRRARNELEGDGTPEVGLLAGKSQRCYSCGPEAWLVLDRHRFDKR